MILPRTKEILLSVAEKLRLPVAPKTLKQRYPERNVNNYTMKYCGSLQTARVMDYLYDDSTVYLERKYQKLKTYLNSRSK